MEYDPDQSDQQNNLDSTRQSEDETERPDRNNVSQPTSLTTLAQLLTEDNDSRLLIESILSDEQETPKPFRAINEKELANQKEKLSGEVLLTHLLRVSRQMSEMRTLAPLLLFAIDEVLRLVGAGRGYIVLLNDDDSLDYRVKRRADGKGSLSETDPVSHSVLNEVTQTQQSVLVRNAIMDPRFAGSRSVMAKQKRSIMCVPLISKDQVIGAIYVENRTKSGLFRRRDLVPLEFFSNQAAVAIENAFLNENLEQLVAKRTRQLSEAKEIAEASNEAKTTFLSNMSHELRTPLNAILNFSGFVLDEYFGDVNLEQAKALQQVVDSGEHLLSLINDVLDLNKIEAGMMNLVFTEVDIAKMLQHSISTATGLVKGKEIEIIAEIDQDLPTIQADQRRIRQIFINLLSNAAKYTLEGEITIRAQVIDEMIQVSIQDTGIGISIEDQELVFESYKEATHNLENVMSTGLGLPITKQLLTYHEGHIWVESEVNVGSTFYVQLPIK
ncbi:MAG: GAF domain-containing protein [Chloroflexi bacterium]|nr:GAF domain-containing protein [Chloroflexota bacterium]